MIVRAASWLYIFMLSFVIGCCSPAMENRQSRTPQRDVLTNETYKNLIVEVMYVWSGTAAPNVSDLEYLKTKIKQYCHKTNVVIVVDQPVPFVNIPTYFWDSYFLSFFENQHALYITAGDTLVIRILYVPGWYSPDHAIRGLAYGSGACCLFRNNIMSASQERAVLLHEFGHIIGLVNCGTPNIRDHEEPDKTHRLHCKNQDTCVMYWSSPDTQTPDFCVDCKLDIARNGGKK